MKALVRLFRVLGLLFVLAEGSRYFRLSQGVIIFSQNATLKCKVAGNPLVYEPTNLYMYSLREVLRQVVLFIRLICRQDVQRVPLRKERAPRTSSRFVMLKLLKRLPPYLVKYVGFGFA